MNAKQLIRSWYDAASASDNEMTAEECAAAEVIRLRATNAELVAALRQLCHAETNYQHACAFGASYDAAIADEAMKREFRSARAAIEKATK